MDPTDAEAVYAEMKNSCLRIVLNRPTKLNALTESMAAQIATLLERARVDDEVRVVLLRGEGRAFCAGDDLGRVIPPELGPPDVQTKLRTSYVRVILDLLQLRKPIIAALHGYALGAGLDLALACDLRIGAQGLKMGSPVVQWGLGGAGVYLMTQCLGLAGATEFLLLGDAMSDQRALQLGLLNELVPVDEFDATVDRYVERLAGAATASIGLIKTARNRALGADPVHGLEAQVIANLELPLLTDPDEGRAAWREHRAPRFTGRYRQQRVAQQ
jgi:enoyl-CoA hydratase/carnithine racemase